MEKKTTIWSYLIISIVTTLVCCGILFFVFTSRLSIFTNTQPSTTTISSFQNEVFQAISWVLPSVVSISAYADIASYINDPSQIQPPSSLSWKVVLWWASWILISKRWYVLTNKHAIPLTWWSYSVRLTNGKVYPVQQVWHDPVLDLAIVKFEFPSSEADLLSVAQFLSFEESPVLWQFVLAIGNAQAEYPNTVTLGILSAQQKPFLIANKNVYTTLYQTDAHVSPGNSGWPLIDLWWRVLWLISSLDTIQYIAYALPLSSSLVETLLQSIDQYGKIVKPLLWIEYIDITPDVQKEKKLKSDSWVLVTSVLSNMPAFAAGIQVWDILLSLDGTPFSTTRTLLYHLYTQLPNSSVTFSVMRNGEKIEIPVQLWQNGD